MKTIIIFVSALISMPVLAHWDLNDVSYLMPLPKYYKDSGLLTDKSVGAKGDLLPGKLLQMVPHLTNGNQTNHTTQGLQVLGLRIDPCFPMPTPQPCQKQIRMVWQPLEMHPALGVMSVDATLHSFYVLTDDEFTLLLKDLVDWKKKYNVQTANLPLAIHPAWKTSKDDSLQDFNKIILKYAGATNISRVTIMALRGGGLMWHFTGIDIAIDGSVNKMLIPRLKNASVQSFVNNASPFTQFAGGFAPKPTGPDTINSIAKDSSLTEKQVVIAEIGAAFRAEDPHLHNPNTLDCMTCHISQPAKIWAFSHHPDWALDKLNEATAYKNARYNLANASGQWRTNNLRAFGYFNKDIYLSQRVINESAEVADALNLIMPLN